MANHFNNYFNNIGNGLTNKIPHVEINYKNIKPTVSSLYMSETNSYEILKIINNLKVTSGGFDKINAKTLRTLFNFISEPLAHIINLSIQLGTWPIELKKAIIVPIYIRVVKS